MRPRMAAKNTTTQNAPLRDNWFDLPAEENNQNELKAKQWQTERRETDDEASIGNLHYGTETERDNLRETAPQQEMNPDHSNDEFSTTVFADHDDSDHTYQTTDEPATSRSHSSVDKTGPLPSAEALSGGNTAPLSTKSPDIQHVNTGDTPYSQDGAAGEDAFNTPPQAAATGTKNSQTPGPATTQSDTTTGQSGPTDGPAQADEPVNHAPLATDDAAATGENSAVVIDVLANDSDADGDPLHITEVSVDDGLGMVGINDDGTITFDPGSDFDHLAQGETQETAIAYTISDGHGGTSTATTTVTVTGTNDTPTVSGAVALPGGTEDSSQSFSTADLLANSSDIDTNDTLSVTNISVDPEQGTLTTNTDGTFTFTPRQDFNGEVTVHYDVSDGIDSTATTASINLEATADQAV
ncbi:MAG TPA: tandem-95 repeat protein, partial [Desulfobulbus sp.]|nr:tandem-95 repeat protein [Desulfobulbus sp.]